LLLNTLNASHLQNDLSELDLRSLLD